jgi:hypothetical protein
MYMCTVPTPVPTCIYLFDGLLEIPGYMYIRNFFYCSDSASNDNNLHHKNIKDQTWNMATQLSC